MRNGDAGIEKGDERIWIEMRPGVVLRWHCYAFQSCLVRVVFGQHRAAFPLGSWKYISMGAKEKGWKWKLSQPR